MQKKRTLLSKADEPRKWKEHMQSFSLATSTILEKFSFSPENILLCKNREDSTHDNKQ